MRSLTQINRTVLFSVVAALAMVVSLAPAARAQDAEMPEMPELDFSFGASYTVVSDYIWRGMNFSEYDGEGREELNHQADLSVTMGTEVGDFTAGVWMEFYEAQHDMESDSNCALQEFDYYLGYGNSYGYLSYGVTWTYYTFPHVSGDAKTTNEIALSAELDDTCLFGMPVLTPSVTYNIDLDESNGNGWVDIGVSHSFEIPGMESLSITPSLTLGLDRQFTDSSKNRLGALVYGVEAAYDLSSIMPDGMGLSLAAFVNYCQILESDDDMNGPEADGATDDLKDEFYGGLTLSLEF